jgi:hypothetical protein
MDMVRQFSVTYMPFLGLIPKNIIKKLKNFTYWANSFD